MTERAIILGAREIIDENDLPLPPSSTDYMTADSPFSGGGEVVLPQPSIEAGAAEGGYRFRLPVDGIDLESVERDFIRQSIDVTGGNQTRAAEMLGLTRDALRYRMKKFGFL